MKTVKFDAVGAVVYAKKWALKRNPQFYNFDNIGGDCTNFISQCIYSGAKTMNYTPIMGWYYKSINNRAPAWTGVNELYSFLINNKSIGPFATRVQISKVELGDVIQLWKSNKGYFHTLIVSEITPYSIYVCSHSRDALNFPLERFNFEKLRCLRISGVNVK